MLKMAVVIGIYGQRYDATGTTSGAEFQVNTYTTILKSPLSQFAFRWWICCHLDFRWSRRRGYGIYGQRYDASGTTSGAEFQVNTYTSSNQSFPSVSALSDGGFVVTWRSDGQDGMVMAFMVNAMMPLVRLLAQNFR